MTLKLWGAAVAMLFVVGAGASELPLTLPMELVEA